MAGPVTALAAIRAQSSIGEVLRDAESGAAEGERVWVEVDGRETRFAVRRGARLVSDDGQYSAVPVPSAMQLDLYRRSEPAGVLRLGALRAALPKAWGRTTCGGVFGSQVILGDDAGAVRVVDLDDAQQAATALGGHALHTSAAGFFPSGQVAYSAGMDYSVKIWDLASQALVQTLRHQKGLVESVGLVGRGRNLLTLSSAAESVVLWDVGKPQVVHEYRVPGAACLAVAHTRTEAGAGAGAGAASAPGEGGLYDAEGRIGVVGTPSSLLALDLRARSTNTLVAEPCTSVAACAHTVLRAAGATAVAHDVRMPQTALYTLVSTQGAVTALALTPAKAYVQTDASFYGYDVKTAAVEVLCTEPRGCAATSNDELWHLGDTEIRQFPF